MSNFSDFSLGLNLPIQDAAEEFVRKKRALQLLNAYWVRFNVILLNVKLCENLGQPFDDLTWNELWEFACHVYPESRSTFNEIQSAETLPEVPHPFPPSLAIAKRGNIEEYLNKGRFN